MTTLDQKIRERLGTDAGSHAIHAVLALHPVTRLGDTAWCQTCSCTCRPGNGADYACPTVEAVAAALGISQETPDAE
jgi:hypothetical protein